MRNIKLICALIILLALPSLAAAGTLENVDGVADCNSWAANLTISFRANAMAARIEYAVVLRDAAGAEVDRFEYADFIDIPDTPTAVYNFTGDWNTVLDGDYIVSGDFTVYDIFGDGYNQSFGTFTTDLACGTTNSDPVCIFPANYWAQHPDEWPVTNLEISGQMRDQAALLCMLGRHHRIFGFQLVRQLVAAKLNLANGADAEIMPVIDETDAYLNTRPTNRRSFGRSRQRVMWLKASLFHYNRRGCNSPENDGVTMNLGDGFAKSAEKAAVEIMSLGSIKAMYQ